MQGAQHNGKRLLLVGATGRVGRMVAHHWAGSDLFLQHRLIGAKGLYWPLLDGPAPLVDHVSRTGAIDTMIMLAGVTPASGFDLGLNTILALAAIAAAKAAGIGRILVASSSAVYGAGTGLPLHETAPLTPVNPYGKAKCAMEAALDRHRDGLEICALRIGNVAGADAALLNVAQYAAEQPLILDRFADGQGPLRSYIGARTLARVLNSLACQVAPLPAVLNTAAPNPVSMESLVTATGHPLQFRAAPPAAHQHITLDCARLAALYPFEAGDSDPATMVADWKVTAKR